MYLFIFILFRIFLLANKDPDLHSAASVQGLHCLPLSPKWDARLTWVKLCVIYSRLDLHKRKCHVALLSVLTLQGLA